ncbi:MAG: hypothetical protein H7Z43_11940 [Clostridia bacterium]|nr:hypothetical protein [Deltaproteobacteria bacterium]
MKSLLVAIALLAASCGGAQNNGKPASIDADASEYKAYGLTVERPPQWTFVTPDASVATDTLVILQGPIGNSTLAPVVEVARRTITASDRRRAPAQILAAMITELGQTFDGFEADGTVQECEVGERKGSRINVHLTESLSDGTEERRAAKMYVIVDGEQIWVLRALGPGDGSADGQLENVVSRMHFGATLR